MISAGNKRKAFIPEGTARGIDLTGLPLASFPRRAGAFLLDLTLAGLLFGAVGTLAAPLLVHLGVVEESDEIIFALNLNWYSIVWTVLYYGLSTYAGNGRSAGKALFRIRVVSLVHPRITLWHCIERSLGYGASLLEGGFGFIQYFFHPNRMTVHDRIAETIVVYEPRNVREPKP